jgi:Sulfotransferase domain
MASQYDDVSPPRGMPGKMIKRLIAGVKRAFDLHRPGRSLIIVPDDTFLVSYPKSGNTWARLLIANLLSPEKPADFRTINQLVPDPASESKRHFVRMPRPRVIKSHFVFDPRYPRVIYIVRDPRDVVLSEYHYQRKTRRISDQYPLEDYVQLFLAGQTYVENGSWGEHVTGWLAARDGDPRFLLVRYEALLSNSVGELDRIASFLGISRTSERLADIVQLSSVDRMRELEAKQGDASSLMKGSRKDVPFVRSAKSEGWRSDLPDLLVEKIEAAWGPVMRYLGYDLRFPPDPKTLDAPDFVLRRR